MNPERTIAYRKQVGALLEAILSEEISPRTALNCWPMESMPDPSVACAYTIVWYFEADEDRHHQEMFYADMQLQLIQQVAHLLKMGQPLALSLIQEYQGCTAPIQYADQNTWRTPLAKVRQEVAKIRHIIETHPWLQRHHSKTKEPFKVKGPFG